MTREPGAEEGAVVPAARLLPDHLDLLAEPLRTPPRGRDDARRDTDADDVAAGPQQPGAGAGRPGGGASSGDVADAEVQASGGPNGGIRAGEATASADPTGVASTVGRAPEHAPPGRTPSGRASTERVPTEPAPTGQAPTERVPTEPTPTEPTPTERVTPGQVSTERVPPEQTPTAQAPTVHAPTEQVPHGQVPTGQVPNARASAAQVATAQTPTEPVSTERTPDGGAPTGDVPRHDPLPHPVQIARRGDDLPSAPSSRPAPEATRALPAVSTAPSREPGAPQPVHHGGGSHSGTRPGAWAPPPHAAPEVPSARHRRQPWAVIVLTMLFALTLALATYLVVLTRAHEERAAEWEEVARTTGTELAQQRAELDGALAELEAVRTQLQTAQARITELADEKAQIGDEREAQRQLVDYQARVSEAAGKVAGALDVCVDGQYQLINYLENAAAYDAADLARFRTDVQQVCGAARDANAALQLELER